MTSGVNGDGGGLGEVEGKPAAKILKLILDGCCCKEYGFGGCFGQVLRVSSGESLGSHEPARGCGSGV